MILWGQFWGRLDWLRRFFIYLDLSLTGHWTLCDRCRRFGPRYFCDCE